MTRRPSAVFERLGRVREATSSPRVDVAMYGGERADRLRAHYEARHPRYRVIRRKTLGVALIEVPPSLDAYLEGPERRDMRKNRGRAMRRGYTFASVSTPAHVEEIVEINGSAPARQGAAIPARMMDEGRVRRELAAVPELWAVLDEKGRMRAYCDAPLLGEVAVLARLLGHADHLRDGIMDLLISGVVAEVSAVRARTGEPRWIEYGTLWSCTAGMAAFKRRLGFRPYRVRWRPAP